MSLSIAAPDVGAREVARAVDVLRDGRLADGPAVREFEDAFADYCDAEHAVATANGTTALHAALRAVGVGPGDRVVTTPFSFVATANAVRLCGAEPVFADVDPNTFNLDPASVRRAVADAEAELAAGSAPADGAADAGDDASARGSADHAGDRGSAGDGEVAAILAVHLYGLPAPMDELRAIADEHGCALVEDAAQAHGAEICGRPVGAIGDAGAFSFYPTKNATCGEGGMVVTDDDAVAERAGRFVNHGRAEAGGDGGYEHVAVGQNYRMTSVAAAIGSAQLRKLPRYTAARRRAAERYTEALEDVEAVRAPVEPAGARHVYHQYTVRTRDREALRGYLAEHDVETAVYYPTPIHRQPAYDRDASYPVAERLAEQVLSIPVHPGLSEADVDRIAALLADYDPAEHASEHGAAADDRSETVAPEDGASEGAAPDGEASEPGAPEADSSEVEP